LQIELRTGKSYISCNGPSEPDDLQPVFGEFFDTLFFCQCTSYLFIPVIRFRDIFIIQKYFPSCVFQYRINILLLPLFSENDRLIFHSIMVFRGVNIITLLYSNPVVCKPHRRFLIKVLIVDTNTELPLLVTASRYCFPTKVK